VALSFPTLGGKQLWGDVFLYAGLRIQRNVLTRHFRLLGTSDERLASGSWAHCHATFCRLRDQRGLTLRSTHLVLLLHGMFRSKDSFGPMARTLRAAGYEAHGVNYPSTRLSLADHADQVEALLDRQQGIETVSLVTHSMGGIVARVLLSRAEAAWRRRIRVHRLLMIATPNQGAQMAVEVGRLGGFDAIAGPALRELHPVRAADLPTPDVPFGIIAGGRGTPRGYNPLLAGDDDMTVAVEETKLHGAEAFLVVRAVHTFIMAHPEVVRAAQHYLATGRFVD